MKKAVVRFTEINHRLGINKRHSKTLSVPDKTFAGWDWDGIVKIFDSEINRSCNYSKDSTYKVTSIKLGRATLLSDRNIRLDLTEKGA